jgi:hypothetical protein
MAKTLNLSSLSDVLRDCDANLAALDDANLSDEVKWDKLMDLYDWMEQIGKTMTKVQTSLRKKYKFSKKEYVEYFEEDPEPKNKDDEKDD